MNKLRLFLCLLMALFVGCEDTTENNTDTSGDSDIVVCKVIFNSNGGTNVATQYVEYNSTASEPTAPTKSESVFDGWYTESGLNNLYNFNLKVTSAFTLYAKWIVNSSGTEPDTGTDTGTEAGSETGTDTDSNTDYTTTNEAPDLTSDNAW